MDKKTGEATSRPLLSMIRKVTNDGSPPKVGVACARSLEGIDYLVWVRVSPYSSQECIFIYIDNGLI